MFKLPIIYIVQCRLESMQMPLATRNGQSEPSLTTIFASVFLYEIGIVEFCILFSSLLNREKQNVTHCSGDVFDLIRNNIETPYY